MNSILVLENTTTNNKCLDIDNKLAKQHNAGLKQLLKRGMQTRYKEIHPNYYNFILSAIAIKQGEAYKNIIQNMKVIFFFHILFGMMKNIVRGRDMNNIVIDMAQIWY